MTKGVRVEGAPGAVVGLLHEEAKDPSLIDHNRSNREGDGEKKTGQGTRGAPPL